MLDSEDILLLREVFQNSLHFTDNLSAQRFRAQHHQQLGRLDSLEQWGYIRKANGQYFVRPVALRELAQTDPQARSLLYQCDDIFHLLSSWYRDNAGESITAKALATLAEIPLPQVQTALRYMSEVTMFDSFTRTADGAIHTMEPSERILRYETFSDMIDAQAAEADRYRKAEWGVASFEKVVPQAKPTQSEYVASERIEALEELDTRRFDLRKLVRLCEELNDCWARDNCFAVAALLRSLLDHVPPIFGHNTFKEVANNFAGRSTKNVLLKLEESCREISNSLIHGPIRRCEILPTRVRVNFSHELDVLLGEICRLLSDNR